MMYHSRDGLVGGDQLADSLTSSKPHIRCMARGAAADFTSPTVRWIEDELNNRRSDPTNVLYALAAMQIQTFASVVAQVMPAGKDRIAADLYAELVKDKMLRHIKMTRDTCAALRKEGRSA